MPFDQYRTVVAALDRLTTQVGRVADAVSTPVVEPDDAPQTTDDDVRQLLADTLEAADYRPDMRRGDLADAVMPVVRAVLNDRDRLDAELARIRRAFDPDDETYIQETVDDQLTMRRRIQHLEAAEQQRDRLAAVLRDVLDHFTHETHPGQRCLQSSHVPVATVDQWRAALTTQEH